MTKREPVLSDGGHRSRAQFADPVFAGVQEAAPVVAQAAQDAAQVAPVDSNAQLLTGIIFYVVMMGALTFWDEHVLPKLQDRGLMPEIPGTLRYERMKRLSKEQRSVPWTTPLTADRSLPSLDKIVSQATRVSSNSLLNVVQFIKAHAPGEATDPDLHGSRPADGAEFEADEYDAVCCVSPEWSGHYGQNVYICKAPADSSVKFSTITVPVDDYQA